MAFYIDRNGNYREVPESNLYARLAIANAAHAIDIKEDAGIQKIIGQPGDSLYQQHAELNAASAIGEEGNSRLNEARNERQGQIMARLQSKVKTRESYNESGVQRRKVKNFMEHPIITAHDDISITEAWALFKHHQLHFIPIVDQHEKFKGLISDRGMLFHLMEIADEQSLNGGVEEFLMDKVPVISPDADLREAALALIISKVGVLPVVNDQQHVVGMVNGNALLRTMLIDKRPLNVKA